MSVRILVADDHAAIRSGLRLILEGAPDVEVVGEAADGAASIANARALHPDVVLMDVRMPGTDGIEATRVITGERLADVLVLTTFDVDEYVFGVLRAGAAGFLLKTVDAPTLLDAVRRVAAGEGVLAPEVTRTLLGAFVDGAGPGTDGGVGRPGAARDTVGHEAVPGLDTLTDREREVLACLGRGLSNADITAELVITEATAKTHVSRVLAKLQVRSRVQAAIAARTAGLA